MTRLSTKLLLLVLAVFLLAGCTTQTGGVQFPVITPDKSVTIEVGAHLIIDGLFLAECQPKLKLSADECTKLNNDVDSSLHTLIADLTSGADVSPAEHQAVRDELINVLVRAGVPKFTAQGGVNLVANYILQRLGKSTAEAGGSTKKVEAFR